MHFSKQLSVPGTKSNMFWGPVRNDWIEASSCQSNSNFFMNSRVGVSNFKYPDLKFIHDVVEFGSQEEIADVWKTT